MKQKPFPKRRRSTSDTSTKPVFRYFHTRLHACDDHQNYVADSGESLTLLLWGSNELCARCGEEQRTFPMPAFFDLANE